MNVFDLLREKFKQKKKISIDLSNEYRDSDKRLSTGYANKALAMGEAIEIVNQVEHEYNNDFCEWEYDEFEDGWQTSCDTVFSLCDSDKEITNFCPCCGKKIKVVE